MNNTPDTAPVTLESIAQQKAALLQHIQRQQKIMAGLSRDIFAPLAPVTNKAGSMMRAFNTGMAIFDGAMLGLKLIKRFRSLLGRGHN